MSTMTQPTGALTGTCYFPTIGHALAYYRPYLQFEDTSRVGLADLVHRKLEAGEIHLGKPTLQAGQRAYVTDNRWHIVDGGGR